jgi:hypothetical protein
MSALKKPGRWLLLLPAGIIFCACLLVRFCLPLAPARPYFPDSYTRLPQVHWLFARFQPVFLFPFARGDAGFFKVAYRDARQKLRLMDIYVGVLKPAPALVGVSVDGQLRPVVRLSAYWQYFRPGDRVSLTYLRAVTPRPGTPAASAAPPSSDQGRQVCAQLPPLCPPAELAEADPDSYWNLAVTGRFPAQALFPVIGISSVLEN